MRHKAEVSDVDTTRLIGRVRAAHLGILVLIALVTLSGQLMTVRALERNRKGSELVDLANRVAIESQTFVSYSQALADQSTSPWDRRELSSRLRKGLDDWSQIAFQLQRDVEAAGDSPKLQSSLQSSEILRRQLAHQFRTQLALPATSVKAIALARASVVQEEAFLSEFEPVTQAIRELVAKRVAALRLTIWLSLAVTLLALAVEGIILFRPMLNRVAAAIQAQRALGLTESLRQSEERLRAAIEGSFDAFFLMNAVKNEGGAVVDFHLSETNSIAEELLGASGTELTVTSLRQIFPAPLTNKLLARFVQCMAESTSFRMEIEVGPRPNLVRWLELQVAPVPGGVAVTARDLTERKQSEISMRAEQFELQAANAQLSHLASTDALTGLYNRRALKAMLSSEAQHAREFGAPVGVIMADLDNFKVLNDQHGHVAGDQVLRSVSDIIQNGLRPSDFAARYGGEEFAIVLRSTDTEGAMAMAERLRHTVESTRFPYGTITLSLGVASWCPTAPSGDDLVRAADEALYQAKRAGKNNCRLAHPPIELFSHREG
ncbi:sensor domain-containing diguanylate cyclase [Fimbriimonas ginsengisoli]|uniref:Diguanylate cyclase n=1 Tax=Fimbriimonas ginsengisoli Gsoil 348 TaxID=661478 RepID=A0A068NXB2_FIMGI|nr:sensor domain-containing diguanylate cyclase [Fimbriimonas ginsengisoli]AIE87987.1 diguanylate cyclase [Fimbriimonas ginsengisoli Gsoil 348]